MSYSSKRNIVSMILGILLIAAYIVYALGGTSPAPEDLKSWAVAMLVFIGISVVIIIVIQILFHITFAIGIAIKEQESDEKKIGRIISSLMLEDEREKLIGLKSSHVGYVCAGLGFIVALVALVLDISILFALHVLFGSFAIGLLIEGGVSVYLYERGFRNG